MSEIQEKEHFVMSPSLGSYAMFLPPDMASVKSFRKELRKSLTENHFSLENIMQIELAADEALTNSVAANVCNCSDETIICRWRINGSKFTLYVLDYGSGLKAEEEEEEAEKAFTSNPCLATFIGNVINHQTKKPALLPYNGQNQKHKNMGKGLKIINAMMDSVKVMFHGEGEVEEVPRGFKVMGSILTLEYDSAKHL